MAAIGGIPGDSTGGVEFEAYGSIPPTDRRWSDADRDLVAYQIAYAERDQDVRAGVAAAVLDALTAAGWRPAAGDVLDEHLELHAARIRQGTAEQIAQALLAHDPAEWALAGQHAGEDAAAIARAHATTLTGEDPDRA